MERTKNSHYHTWSSEKSSPAHQFYSKEKNKDKNRVSLDLTRRCIKFKIKPRNCRIDIVPADPTTIAVVLLLGYLKNETKSVWWIFEVQRSLSILEEPKYNWRALTSSSNNLHISQKYLAMCTPQLIHTCLT